MVRERAVERFERQSSTKQHHVRSTYQHAILSFDGMRRGQDWRWWLLPEHHGVGAGARLSRRRCELNEERGIALAVRKLHNTLNRARRRQDGLSSQVGLQLTHGSPVEHRRRAGRHAWFVPVVATGVAVVVTGHTKVPRGVRRTATCSSYGPDREYPSPNFSKRCRILNFAELKKLPLASCWRTHIQR